MRTLLALLALSMAVAGCSSAHGTAPDTRSLSLLRHLTSDEQSFGVVLDAGTGRALGAFRVNNPIRAAVPDGAGGWYVGGGFIYVNGELRKRLAHIPADGSLDPDWRPEANGNGVSVTSLARIGSRLYVAGDFAKLQHRPRFQLGALALPSGRLTNWRADRSARYSYDALFGAGRRVIFAGACCSEAGSAAGALDVASGTTDQRWRPHVGRTNLYGDGVYMLTDGMHAILVHGLFGRGRSRVVAGELDPTNGELVSRWSVRASEPCLWCTLMAAGVGRHRIFASVNGGAGRYRLVAFDRRTGQLDRRWRARLSATTGFYGANSVSAIAVANGRVYVTGDFDHVNGVRRNGFAALDARTARVVRSWTPRASSVSGWILSRSGNRVLLGVTLANRLQFSYAGLKTYRPVRTLKLVLALNGRGSVRIGLGQGCNVGRWASSSSLRCGGRVLHWLATVRFAEAARKHYVHHLTVPSGRYFVRFVPRSPTGVPQPAVQDFPIVVP